jgi:hypothetical protein
MSGFEGRHPKPGRSSRTKALILYEGAHFNRGAHAHTTFAAIPSAPVGEINLRKEGAQRWSSAFSLSSVQPEGGTPRKEGAQAIEAGSREGDSLR